MRVIVVLCLAFSLGATAGCGSHSAVAPSESPLTVEAWKALPPDTKYEIETLERLKLGDPKLQEQRAWDKFTRDILLPSKKKDQPAGKSP